MTRREFALDSFWSERPLVRLFMQRTGLASFSLRQLIAFAEALPEDVFETMRGGCSQHPPHVAAPTRRPVQEAQRHGNIITQHYKETSL